MFDRFDNANQEKYKNKKKINEILFKDPKLDIKSIILLIYIYYLNFSLYSLFFKISKINFRIWLTFIFNETIMTKIKFNCESSFRYF